MANQQGLGGNSMAALLGNMQNPTQRNPPGGYFGGGLQPGMQRPRAATPTGQPIPPGGQGYPQMSPQAMQTMAGQLSKQWQSGAPGNTALQAPGGWQPMAQQPGRLPSFGSPPAGGAGKGQAIGSLPGGPGPGIPPGGVGPGMLPGRPGIRPMQRPRLPLGPTNLAR